MSVRADLAAARHEYRTLCWRCSLKVIPYASSTDGGLPPSSPRDPKSMIRRTAQRHAAAHLPLRHDANSALLSQAVQLAGKGVTASVSVPAENPWLLKGNSISTAVCRTKTASSQLAFEVFVS